MEALAAAIYDFAVGVFHLMFWRLFGWSDRLPPSGPVNAAVTQTLNIVLIYVLFAFAAGILWANWFDRDATFPLIAGAGFWLLRAALQPLLFALPRPMTLRLTALWLVGATLHGVAATA
jgi:hypothetical protein